MSMKFFLKSIAFRAGISLQIGKCTSRSDLKTFFELIHPITTEIPLIRLGGGGDGGYLLPDDLENIKYCFSPGVAETVNFELDCANRGIHSFLADFSVDTLPVENPRFSFEKKFIGVENSHVFIRLEDWILNHVKHSTDLLLQMDIEGSEYSVLSDTPLPILCQFRIMVIEFHNLEWIFSKETFPFIRNTFSRLLKDFSIVHIHPNNVSPSYRHGEFVVPPTMEFTFLRNDRFSAAKPTTLFPHALDSENAAGGIYSVLPGCWHAK